MLGFGNRKQNRNFNEQMPYGMPQNMGGYNNAPYAPQGMPQGMMQEMPMQQNMQPPQVNSRDEEYIDMKVAEIDRQVKEFSQKNPNFDIRREIQNPAFCTYVWGNGLSVEDAYYLAHRDEQDKGTMRLGNPAAENAAQKRIFENGAGRTAGSGMVKKNPKDLSDEELDDIVKRVRNGEKISF